MALPQNIQAVTFDVGGTLIVPWPSVGHVYAQVAAQHGYKNLDPELLNLQFGAAWKQKHAFDHSRPAWLDLVRKTFSGFTPEKAVELFFDDIYERFSDPAAWRVFDEVHPTLKRLASRGLKLGIISNWDERLRPLLRRLQLAEYFEVIVISHEAGFAKPAPEIFQRAAASLGVPAGAILHIGDSLEEDVVGARTAGFQALSLIRKAPSRPVSSGPTISSLDEVLGDAGDC